MSVAAAAPRAWRDTRTPQERIADADRCLQQACMLLTRATCLLGASEGKRDVQELHALAYDAHRASLLLMIRRAFPRLPVPLPWDAPR